MPVLDAAATETSWQRQSRMILEPCNMLHENYKIWNGRSEVIKTSLTEKFRLLGILATQHGIGMHCEQLRPRMVLQRRSPGDVTLQARSGSCAPVRGNGRKSTSCENAKG
eukprot:Skav201993  [mRNA]  locus=scaffold269:153044:153373:+ [translate_table: standard]